jgi:preprotein translocase subunit YajC
MNLFISDALAQTPPNAGAPPGGGYGFVIMMGALLLVMYFLMIRPQAKRAKETKSMLAALAKGDEVVAAGGVLGRITQLGDTFVTLEVAEGVEIKVQRQAIQAVMPKGTIKSA